MLDRIKTLASLIKFSHSVFALPFALMMLVVVHQKIRAVEPRQILLIVVCVVAARSAAMGFNRLVDAGIDKLNPRTAKREIPDGRVSSVEVWSLVCGSSAAFIVGAAALGLHCAYLAPVVLAILFLYSYVKRFSSACHFVLGIALSLAPGGVWYALTATWSWMPVPLMLGVLFWVAGFDILYACQDAEFDQQQGLFSVPSRLGVSGARRVAALSHLVALVFLAVFGVIFELGAIFWIGYIAFALLILSQHITVARGGIGQIDQVFFTRNGLASVGLLLFTVLEWLVRG